MTVDRQTSVRWGGVTSFLSILLVARRVLSHPVILSKANRVDLQAEGYERTAPKLVQWAEENLPQGFTVFDFPPSHRRRLRTTNLLERMKRGDPTPDACRQALPQRRFLPAPGHRDRDGNFGRLADGRQTLSDIYRLRAQIS